VVELQLLSLSVMVPSKSVKKMILGCALRVSGNGIANEGTGELGAETTEEILIEKRKREEARERKDKNYM
jgi:hypothetical protein